MPNIIGYDPSHAEIANTSSGILDLVNSIQSEMTAEVVPSDKPKSNEGKLALLIAQRTIGLDPTLLAHFMAGHGTANNKRLFAVVVNFLLALENNLNAGLFFDEEERQVCLAARKMLEDLHKVESSDEPDPAKSDKNLPNPSNIWE